MRDFMPCTGCDEPEACEIASRCLEPAARMLTSEELAECCGGCRTNSAIETWMRRAIAKFCEVNGIELPDGVPEAPAPSRHDDVQNLLFDIRGAMLRYGTAFKAGDEDGIRSSTTEACDLLDKLAARASGVAASEPADPFIVSAALRLLIADDAYAITFQTMGQYRSALLKAIRDAEHAAGVDSVEGGQHG